MARTTWRLLLSTLIAAVCGGALGADGTLSLKSVMRRVGTYVEDFGQKASIIVATERYTQTLNDNTRAGMQERSLVSEFAIVRAEASDAWIGFRDVIEVDGARVTDHGDRLVEVLTTASGGIDEARQLSDESARFNIGTMERNFNVPTATLFFFTADNLDRFRFKLIARTTDTWEIAFRETRKPTLIRTLDGVSVPCEGSLWVNPDDGRISRTELRLRGFSDPNANLREGSVAIDVTYGLVPKLGMWLPETMTESYDATERSGAWNRVTARAEYSNYRRFETSARMK